MSFFKSANVKVFPTAYRQYTTENDGVSTTTPVNVEARLNTEYNITNLVNGLLDNTINNGNFVVDASVSGNNRILKFCMKGYYFEVTEVPTNITDLWVKIETSPFGYGQELVPINYASGGQRDLDEKVNDVINFIGLNYVQSEPNDSEYLRILENGRVPEKSKIRFSINQIGYLDGTTWVSLETKFKTKTLEANDSFKSPNILIDTSNNFQVKGINDNSQTNQAIYVNNSGKIVSGSHASTKSITTGSFNVMDSITMNSDGSLNSVGTKKLPVDTSSLTNDDNHIPSSKLVQTKLNEEVSARNTAITTAIDGLDVAEVGENGKYLQKIKEVDGKISATQQAFDTTIPTNNPSTINAPTTSAVKTYADTKISKDNLTFSYESGVLTIKKTY